MSVIKITVGGDIEAETKQSFADAWHRAERDEKIKEMHLAFENWDALARVLTGKRLEILRHVHKNATNSVRALAKALRRDYSNVHADVQALMGSGLLEVSKLGVRVDYNVIETRIAI